MIQRWLGVTPDVPIFVWAIVLSVIIGTAMTNFLTRAFIDPIMKLREEMLEVAGGNFHVTAVCTSRLREVREIYDSFNRMVRELGTTETLQTDFISSVSHEFKTPINAIEGYAALLQDHQQSQAEQEVYIEKILFNTRRLSTLTGNILLLSKLNNQSIRPQKMSRCGRPFWRWSRNGRKKSWNSMWSWTRPSTAGMRIYCCMSGRTSLTMR